VVDSALEEELEERIVERRAFAETGRGVHVQGYPVVAAEDIGKVGGGEGEVGEPKMRMWLGAWDDGPKTRD
jgi:hypothetical protein